MSRAFRWILFVAVALLLVVCLVAISARRKVSTMVMPNPNGYDAFVQAGAISRSGEVFDYTKLNQDELTGLVKRNSETIRLIKSGLNRECRVRTTNSLAYIQGHIAEIGGFKSLTQLLVAEGRLAQLNGRPSEAARSYLDAIKFGQAMSRGGVMIDALVGVACEAIGMRELESITGKVSAEESREIVAALEAMDETAEPLETTLKNEHEWARRSAPWQTFLLRIVKPGLTKAAEAGFVKKRQQADAQRRRLLLKWAARSYRLENGADAKRDSEIVPRYLKKIPVDPTTEQPIPIPLTEQ